MAEEAVVSAAVVVSASVRAPVKRPEDAEAPPDGSEGPETGVPERPARQNAPIPIARATASTTPPAIHAHSGTGRRRLDAFPPASASSKGPVSPEVCSSGSTNARVASAFSGSSKARVTSVSSGSSPPDGPASSCAGKPDGSPRSSSSAVTPSTSASAVNREISGIPLPLSHLDTALLVTPSLSASCCCVRPISFRRAAIKAPIF